MALMFAAEQAVIGVTKYRDVVMASLTPNQTDTKPDLREAGRLRGETNISDYLSDKFKRSRSILLPGRLNLACWEDEASFGHCTRT